MDFKKRTVLRSNRVWLSELALCMYLLAGQWHSLIARLPEVPDTRGRRQSASVRDHSLSVQVVSGTRFVLLQNIAFFEKREKYGFFGKVGE